MQITLSFKFNHEEQPAAVTGVEGDVTDLLLPAVGDLVEHSKGGVTFAGKVTDRQFRYRIGEGVDVQGAVLITLCMDRTTVH